MIQSLQRAFLAYASTDTLYLLLAVSLAENCFIFSLVWRQTAQLFAHSVRRLTFWFHPSTRRPACCSLARTSQEQPSATLNAVIQLGANGHSLVTRVARYSMVPWGSRFYCNIPRGVESTWSKCSKTIPLPSLASSLCQWHATKAFDDCA